MKKAGCLFIVLIAQALSSTVIARPRPYTPEPGEDPLRAKCKAEVQFMGAGGKASAVQAENNRAMRKEHFKKCMQGG